MGGDSEMLLSKFSEDPAQEGYALDTEDIILLDKAYMAGGSKHSRVLRFGRYIIILDALFMFNLFWLAFGCKMLFYIKSCQLISRLRYMIDDPTE